MTTTEVFNQIISEHKWYAPYMSAQAALLFKKRFLRGELKHSTIDRWFSKFGYEQKPVEWVKKEKVIMSANFECISLMPDGSIEPILTNIVYGQHDQDGDVYMKGCFDKSLNKMK